MNLLCSYVAKADSGQSLSLDTARVNLLVNKINAILKSKIGRITLNGNWLNFYKIKKIII